MSGILRKGTYIRIASNSNRFWVNVNNISYLQVINDKDVKIFLNCGDVLDVTVSSIEGLLSLIESVQS